MFFVCPKLIISKIFGKVNMKVFAFAGPINGAVDSSYLQCVNPLITNPYGYMHGSCNVTVAWMYCRVTVTNTDGTYASKWDSKYNTTGFNSPWQYANTFSSAGVRFDGRVEVSSPIYGDWVANASYTY